jgi:hypothetical protein
MVKKRTYDIAFERARKAGRAAALTTDQRQAEVQRIQDEVVRRLGQ